MALRPRDVARELRISPTTLRRYEHDGLVPPVPRAANGYRMYTEVHLAYFRCIRALVPAFGMDVTTRVLRHIRKGDIDSALWILTEQQTQLFEHKRRAEEILEMLASAGRHTVDGDLSRSLSRRRKWTIGEAAGEIGVATSTIRHWELEGLIDPVRDEANGYRTFTVADIRKLLLIRALRSALYPLDVVRDVIANADNVHVARQIARDALENLSERN